MKEITENRLLTRCGLLSHDTIDTKNFYNSYKLYFVSNLQESSCCQEYTNHWISLVPLLINKTLFMLAYLYKKILNTCFSFFNSLNPSTEN